ncbi:MAG: hypothetical protein KDB65_09260 [Calditrichaeota bacterium]|nr:hypothetical protein [Calditrichota bacterium]MCB9369074.1 hypothetical protein [Calditrichota bacterium]
MSANSLLKKLSLRPAPEETLKLLRALAGEKHSAKSLLAYHDQLLFYKAYPVSVSVRQFADLELAKFHKRVTEKLSYELTQSGLVGTKLYYAFDFKNAKFMHERLGELVDLDWEDYELNEKDPLAGLLWLLLETAEADACDSESLTTREILTRAAGSHTVFSLLLDRFTQVFPDQIGDHLYNDASLMLGMTLAPQGPSRTLTALPSPKNLWLWSPELTRGKFDFADEIEKPLEVPPPCSIRRGQELLNIVHGTLTVRSREYFGAAHGNPAEVYEIPLDRGGVLLVWFFQPEWRLPQEAGWGFLMLKNGVPISYGGGGMHPARLEIALNLFETFRGGEAAWIYASLVRAARSFCPAPWVIARRYQIGYENDEALASGAYWFYDKLGMRSTSTLGRRVAETERKKIAAKKGYRSPVSSLKKIADADVVLGLSGQDPALYSEYPLEEVGLLASDVLSKYAPRDEHFQKRMLIAIEERLGYRLPKMTTMERTWVVQHGAWLLALPATKNWSVQQRETWLAMARGKGGAHEADYLKHAVQLKSYFDALAKEAVKRS